MSDDQYNSYSDVLPLYRIRSKQYIMKVEKLLLSRQYSLNCIKNSNLVFFTINEKH